MNKKETDIYAKWNGSSLKIVIPDILPHYDRLNPLPRATHYDLVNKWKAYVIKAYHSLDVELEFLKVLCLIVTFHNNHGPWDVDNRLYKYAIDGIKSTGIIQDDNWQHLSLMVDGCPDSHNPRTEIYIIDHSIITPLYQFLGVVKR